MLRACIMHACVVFSTWINSSQSSWSNPLTSDRILIGDRAASLSVDLPLSGDGINSCPSSSSSSARSSQSVALISCHRSHRSILAREIIADGKPINERIRWLRRPWRKKDLPRDHLSLRETVWSWQEIVITRYWAFNSWPMNDAL